MKPPSCMVKAVPSHIMFARQSRSNSPCAMLMLFFFLLFRFLHLTYSGDWAMTYIQSSSSSPGRDQFMRPHRQPRARPIPQKKQEQGHNTMSPEPGLRALAWRQSPPLTRHRPASALQLPDDVPTAVDLHVPSQVPSPSRNQSKLASSEPAKRQQSARPHSR
jgi:hypothetical protein